jgi:hypothetical protein
MVDRERVRAEEPHTSGVAAAARSWSTKAKSVLSILFLEENCLQAESGLLRVCPGFGSSG